MGRGKEPKEPNGPFKTEAHLGPLREPVPSRAPFESVKIFAALEQELLAVGNADGKVSSLDRLKLFWTKHPGIPFAANSLFSPWDLGFLLLLLLSWGPMVL